MMNEFYGTKLVKAIPMTRLDYNKYRGWALPNDEDGSDEGYLVEYCDGGKSNHPDHEGYISWSPKEQFDNAYQSTNMMSFGHALAAMKAGKRVARAGWNGKDMFVFLVDGSRFLVNREPLESILGYGTEVVYRPHMDLKTADGSIATWSPSGSDALAEDWQIIDEESSTYDVSGKTLVMMARDFDKSLLSHVKFEDVRFMREGTHFAEKIGPNLSGIKVKNAIFAGFGDEIPDSAITIAQACLDRTKDSAWFVTDDGQAFSDAAELINQ